MTAARTESGRSVRYAQWSLAQLLVSTVSMFVLYRIVLDQVGTRAFGIWSIVVAATSMVGLSNMGLTGSIVKHVAQALGNGDTRRAISMIETTVISVALAAFALSLVGVPLMHAYFSSVLTGTAKTQAISLLPIALLAFVISMVGGIYQSALYGCHLIVERNLVLIAESLTFLAMSVVLAARYGLEGLVLARALQNVLTLAISVVVLRRFLPALPIVPIRWSRPVFRELLSYAMGFQVVSLVAMTMDPLTKGLLSRFGSLEFVTYFEMGSRLIGQARGMVVSANQVLVPTFAQLDASDRGAVEPLFRRSLDVMFFVSVCLFGLLASALPVIGQLWIGRVAPDFVSIGIVLCAGWLLNTLAVPAYFACLGTGRMGTVIRCHLLMSVCNVVLGGGFGWAFGPYGVVGGWAAALAIGGVQQHVEYCRSVGMPVAAWIPRRGAAMVSVSLLALALAYASRHWLAVALGPAVLRADVAGVIVFSLLWLPMVLSHPVAADVSRWVTRRVGHS